MTWVDSLRPLFDGGNDATRNAHIGLDDDRLHTRRAKKRRMLHMLHVANAAKHLDRLPDNGETFHGVMRGNYNGWDLVPAVLEQVDVPVVVGGIIPSQDARSLREQGVAAVYTPADHDMSRIVTHMADIVARANGMR